MVFPSVYLPLVRFARPDYTGAWSIVAGGLRLRPTKMFHNNTRQGYVLRNILKLAGSSKDYTKVRPV